MTGSAGDRGGTQEPRLTEPKPTEADAGLEEEFGDVLGMLRSVTPVEPSRELAARAEDRATVDPTGAAAVQAVYGDDGYALLCGLLGDEELARESIERVMFRVQRHLEELDGAEPTLSWGEFLRFVTEVGAESRRLLRKAGAGRRDGTLDMLDGEDQLYVLLCGGLGLSDDELRVVFPKEDPAARQREVAARLAEALPTPAHEGGSELRSKLAAEVLGLDAPGLIEHRAGCALCSVQAERIREEVDVPPLKLPNPDSVVEAVASRSAKDREHRAAVREIQAKVSVNCTYCHSSMTRAETAFCSTCLAAHHEDCFREHGRCAAPGCGETVAIQPGLASVPVARPRGWRRWAGVVVGVVGFGTVAAVTSAALLAYKDETSRLQDKQAELLEEQQRLMDQAARQDRMARQRAAADLEAVRRNKQLEIQDLRERLTMADDQALFLERKYDQEKKRLSDEKERLLSVLERQEEQVRALAKKLEVEREKLREELWATFQDELERRGLTDVISEMKQEFADVEIEKEVEATFKRIETLAEERKVEDLIKEFETLRALMQQAKGGSEAMQRKISKWQKKLGTFGEVQLDLELMAYEREATQHLLAMEVAGKAKDHAAVRERFARLMKVASDMNGEERQTILRKAREIFASGRTAAARAGAVVGRIKAVDLRVGTLTVGETSYTLKRELLEGAGAYRASFKALMFLQPGSGVILFFEGGLHNQAIVRVYADRLPEPAVSVVVGAVKRIYLIPRPTGNGARRMRGRSWIDIETEEGPERFVLPNSIVDDLTQRDVLEGFDGRAGARVQLTLRGKRVSKVEDVTDAAKVRLVRFERVERVKGHLLFFTTDGETFRCVDTPELKRVLVFLKKNAKVRLLVEGDFVKGLQVGWK